MATDVNQAFREFQKKHVDIDPDKSKQAKGSRDWLMGRIVEIGSRDDFPKLYEDINLHYGSFARKTKLQPLDDKTYFATVFFPSSSAYILGFKEHKEHHDNYAAKQTLEKRINSVIDIAITQKASVDIIMLRQIQDVIYSLRKCTAIVPDWFYSLFRKKYDKRMQAILNKYSTKFTVL